MLTVYVNWVSTPCRAVMMTCEVAGIEVDYEYLDLMMGEQHSAEFLLINPNHCVPTIVDDDFILWESRPIAMYLIDKHAAGHDMFPKDLQKRALIQKMLDFDLATVYKAVGSYVYPRVFRRMNSKPDEMEDIFKHLDQKIFKTSRYAVGDHVTLADVFLIATCTFPELVGYEVSEEKFPNLVAWIKRIKESEFYVKANASFEHVKQEMLK